MNRNSSIGALCLATLLDLSTCHPEDPVIKTSSRNLPTATSSGTLATARVYWAAELGYRHGWQVDSSSVMATNPAPTLTTKP